MKNKNKSFILVRDLFLLPVILLLTSSTVMAASFDVLNTGDAGADTLRQAITDLNTSTENGTIVFNSGAEGTITLGSALSTLNYETIFDTSDYDITLSGYSGGTAADKWFKFDTEGSGTFTFMTATGVSEAGWSSETIITVPWSSPTAARFRTRIPLI